MLKSSNIDTLTKQIEDNPRNAEALFNRARGYMNMDQNQKAVADLTKALEIQPENDRLYYFRALS